MSLNLTSVSVNRIERQMTCFLSIPLQSNEGTGELGILGFYQVNEFTSGDKFVMIMLDDNNNTFLEFNNWWIDGSNSNEIEYASLSNDVVGAETSGSFSVKKISTTAFRVEYLDSSNEFYNFPNPQTFTFLYSENCSTIFASD